MVPERSDVKKNRIFSLKWQYTLIFAGLMAGIICITTLLSSLFLPKYYEFTRIKMIRKAYEELLVASGAGSFSGDDREIGRQIDDMSLKNNMSVIILGDDSRIVYSSRNGERGIDMILIGYILGMPPEATRFEVIEHTDDYEIRKTISSDDVFLEMYGKLDDGYTFLVRTPLESITESARYAARFYLLIGVCGIVAGAVIIFFVSKKMSDPILRLSDISARMVDLDFDARYQGNDRNEIGLLGNNINTMSESLERSISGLKTANNELKRDIEKKEKAAEEHREFISNVSHELKTPIALIQGYAEGLKEGVSDDAESRDYYLDVIMDEASRMNRLVKDLLNLDQLESGEDVIDLERFDIGEVISSYLQSAGMLAADAGVKIIYDEKNGNYVWGDPFKAETVFANFFSNAVHYCKETPAGKYIKINTESRDNILRVCVYNTGDHIPEESLERLWDKFYKVDKARTREYGGSGIGLSIVKAIQTSIGRDYGVYNTEGGVTFWFELESK